MGRHGVELGPIFRLFEYLCNGILDAGKIDDTFTHNGLHDGIIIFVFAVHLGYPFFRAHETEQVFLEPVFDVEQCRGHLDQCRLFNIHTGIDNGLQIRTLGLNNFPQFAKSEYTERIADFFQQFNLWNKLLDMLHAGAYINVQNILNARKIIANCLRDGLHELCAWRTEAFTHEGDLLVAGHQFR